jgi:ferredoxin-NADP reductase
MEARVKFVERRSETHDANSFLFEKPRDLEFTAGQFLKWYVDHPSPDERGIERPFTISASPSEDHLMLTTKLADPSSTFKKALLALKPSQEIAIRGPFGHFILPEIATSPIVFLGGGVGITPFRSMIKFATDTKRPTPITLFYANKTPADIIYHQEFEAWRGENPNLKIIYTVDKPEPGWVGETGYLTAAMIKKYLANLADYTYYICGPPAMIDAYTKVLVELGIPPEKVLLEKFSGY